MEEIFNQGAELVALSLEAVSVLIISVGALLAVARLLRIVKEGFPLELILRSAWLVFARCLLLGLEFTLAADVVRTAIAPSWTQIGQLAAIAAIRTFLNYFLERDVETIIKAKQRRLKEAS